MQDSYGLDLGLSKPVTISEIWESHSPMIEGQNDASMEGRIDAPRIPDVDDKFLGKMAEQKYNVHFTADISIDDIEAICAIREALFSITAWCVTRVLFQVFNCCQMTAEQLSMRLELLPICEPKSLLDREFTASFGGSLPPAKNKSDPMRQKVLTSAHIVGANVFTGGNERGIPLIRLRDGEEIRATLFISKGSSGISYKGNRYGDCRFAPVSLVRFREHPEDPQKVVVSFTKVGNLETEAIFDSLKAEFSPSESLFDDFDFDMDAGADMFDGL